MTKIVPLADAVAELVHDGDTVALEGFAHLVPFAAAHEIIRQGRRDLTLVRLVPDLVDDRLVGAGCVRKLVSSGGGHPGLGSLHRVRDALAHGWPVPLEIEEQSHAGLANRYVAGASGLPFAVLRGYAGTDLPLHASTISSVTCPFTGEELTAVAALNPDVTVVHAQRADRAGNVQFWGGLGVQKEAVLAAERALVTVEEIVDTLDPVPDAVVLPHRVPAAVSLAPRGAAPSPADGYYDRDDTAYRAWDAISRDREAFSAWLKELVV